MPQRKFSNNSESNYVPLIHKIERRIESGDVPFFSIEFFPPKTRSAVDNLIKRFDNFRQLGPLFADITWHAGASCDDDTDPLSMTVADLALNYSWLNTMLHLTCVGMSKERLLAILERAKVIGIRNILALRGDKRPNCTVTDFKFASDLVSFIRQNYGDYFTIAVAGYPTRHPESETKESDLMFLKQKVDAGADFIITQLFFESEVFINFVRDCREIGITVPILPGIMPIQNYDSLEKIARLSQLNLPEKMLRDLEKIKNNDEGVRNYGIEWTIQLCREVIKSDCSPGLHFYTLNRQHATMTIVKALNLVNVSCSKPLPWLTPANHRRCSESVRPIFWSSRPRSYVCRTNTWDEFPNGRWGKVDSPAFGDLNDYYLFFEPKKSKTKLLEMWGFAIDSEEDIWEIFYCYLSGKNNKFGFKVASIPWNEAELRPETNVILEKLAYFNKQGILTINSQPNVNGISSTHPIFGWGAEKGYVYQKAYLEFFISQEKLPNLLEVLLKYPSVNYQMINQKGNVFYTNCSEDESIAVTWGVFPGKEIIQPTIVDIISFKVWKDEAFGLWLDKWALIYPEASKSREVLQTVHDNYFLVNLVDNEFPKDTCLWAILQETLDIA